MATKIGNPFQKKYRPGIWWVEVRKRDARRKQVRLKAKSREDADIERARVRLFENLRANPPPMPLLSQHLPTALQAVRAGAATRDPLSLAVAHVSAVLDDYHHACHTH